MAKVKKVLVGLSGGVDSSVTAHLLVKSGYQVEGVFVEAYNEPGCRTDQDKKDALQVALKLGIPFRILDVRSSYKELVIKYFLEEYQAGRTPNPDIVCNREVKFGILFEYMKNNGFDCLATGHYCRIACGSTKSETCLRRQVRNSKHISNSKITVEQCYLQQPVDKTKDQSYFLWQVGRDKLGQIMFPLGELTKREVREIAKSLRLPNADKPDSMGVCMLGELNMSTFLRKNLGVDPGRVMYRGTVVGEHEGLWFFTEGQRVGQNAIKLDSAKLKLCGIDTTKMPALYVTNKNLEDKSLTIGERELCMSNELKIKDYELAEGVEQIWVRIRNLGELTPVSKYESNNNELQIITNATVFAPARGQCAVFYDREGVVVGGGYL